jgi:hypothetical protein
LKIFVKEGIIKTGNWHKKEKKDELNRAKEAHKQTTMQVKKSI